MCDCVINAGRFVRIEVRLLPDALQKSWCFIRSLQHRQQDLRNLISQASVDFSMLYMLFMFFSQLILKEWGPALDGSCLGHPLSGGVGGEVQVLFVWLECGWVTEISSGLSGIMKLPCQNWGCPGSKGYDSYCVSLELFGSFNCLLFNIPWNVNLERIHVHKCDV